MADQRKEVQLYGNEIEVIIGAMAQQDDNLRWILYTADPNDIEEVKVQVNQHHRLLMQIIYKLQHLLQEEVTNEQS